MAEWPNGRMAQWPDSPMVRGVGVGVGWSWLKVCCCGSFVSLAREPQNCNKTKQHTILRNRYNAHLRTGVSECLVVRINAGLCHSNGEPKAYPIVGSKGVSTKKQKGELIFSLAHTHQMRLVVAGRYSLIVLR
jgi:hypothetical protein